MALEQLRLAFTDDAVADPPPPGGRDWLIAVGTAIAGVIEYFVGSTPWPGASLVVVLLIATAVLWRRTHALAGVIAAFGGVLAVDVASMIAGVQWQGFNSAFPALLLPYALCRWASGRHILIGLGVLAAPALLSGFQAENTIGDVIGGLVILFLSAELGGLVRQRAASAATALEQARSAEREQLARELHDLVAHHVSAIVVQAQAGRTLADRDPSVAVETLARIESEATTALGEMRAMVGTLRSGTEPDLTPQRGVADIHRLHGGDLHLDVSIAGEVDRLRPAVDAAVYRLVQESVTNATRHARDATVVRVEVDARDDQVHLAVSDDGRPPGQPVSPGFGLVGMAERTKLLGGSMMAGPGPQGGWRVEATIPNRAPA